MYLSVANAIVLRKIVKLHITVKVIFKLERYKGLPIAIVAV